MNLNIAHRSQHWQTGGIIERVEWDTDPATLRMWGGQETAVQRGDTVLVFYRGLPAAEIVGVERGT